MARSSGPPVAVRLSVEGGEAVKRDFDGIGASGKRALDSIRNAAIPVPLALRLVDAASREVQDGITALSGRAGTVGRVLAAIGPAGLAVGAGIGAAGLAIGKAASIAADAVREFDELGDRIRDLGVDSDLYQGLRFESRLFGIGGDQFDNALRQFAVRTEELSAGVGRAVRTLKELDPELLRTIQSSGTVEERLRATADAFAREESAVKRATIAKALFGDENVRMAQLLGQGSASLDGFVEKARALGIVIHRDLIARAGELADRMDTASTVIDLNLKQAFIDLAPITTAASELFADLARSLADIVDRTRDIENRTRLAPLYGDLDKVQSDLAAINDQLAEAERFRADAASAGLGTVDADAEIARLTEARAALHKQEAALLNRIGEVQNPPKSAATAAVDAAKTFDQISAGIARSLDTVATKEEEVAKVREELEATVAGLVALRGKEGVDAAAIDAEIAKAREAARRQIEKIEDADKDTRAAAATERRTEAELRGLSERYAAGIKYKALVADIAEAERRGYLSAEEAMTARARAEKEYADALEKERRAVLEMENSYRSGLALGLAEWADKAKEVARSVADAIGNAFSGAEDALVEFVTTGKANFSDLAASIAADLARLAIRQTILGPLSSALSGVFGGGNAGGAALQTPTSFGGGRAAGGPIETGKWYIAGEHGPEPVWGGGPGAFAAGYGAAAKAPAPVVNVTVTSEAGTRAEVKRQSDGTIDIRTMIDRSTAENMRREDSETFRELRRMGLAPAVR